jgi:hypothetical protein
VLASLFWITEPKIFYVYLSDDAVTGMAFHVPPCRPRCHCSHTDKLIRLPESTT